MTAPAVLATALSQVLDRLAAGDLDVDLTSVDGLAAAATAQQALADGRSSGKHVVRLAAPPVLG